jgi:hypothetical protein
MRTAPWHFDLEPIHHDNTECDAGLAVWGSAQAGTGGKRLCAACGKLHEASTQPNVAADSLGERAGA